MAGGGEATRPASHSYFAAGLGPEPQISVTQDEAAATLRPVPCPRRGPLRRLAGSPKWIVLQEMTL